jgi:hypothetical protein
MRPFTRVDELNVFPVHEDPLFALTLNTPLLQKYNIPARPVQSSEEINTRLLRNTLHIPVYEGP